MQENTDKVKSAPQDDNNMTFWEHLDVLRMSLFHILGFVLVAFIGCFIAMPYIFDPVILGPTTSNFFLYKFFASLGHLPFAPDFSDDNFHVDIININVASQFMTHMSTAFWLALVITFPIIMWEIWKFVRPALLPNEKSNISLAFTSGTFMFFLGCAVGYCIVFPLTFRFLTQYRIGDEIQNQINLNSYINMFLMLIFVMGLVFELPLLAWILSKLGLVNKAFLRKYRSYAVVVLLVLAAVITPSGDPFTLMVVFLPLYLLYELSIKVVRDAPPQEEDE